MPGGAVGFIYVGVWIVVIVVAIMVSTAIERGR
jgi:hypothetical protein